MHQRLLDVIEQERIIADPDALLLYSQDVFTEGVLAELVVRPGSVEQLQAIVTLANTHRWALIPRGGAMSYTGGIVPVQQHTLVIDMCDLNRVLEINAEDMTVTVEAGCTWSDLYQALKPLQLRTPYWGTLSGLFTCDCSALGIKARITLSLVPLLATISTHIFVLEPVFFWQDELKALHRATIEPAHLKRIVGFDENLAARAAVTAIREQLLRVYEELGASHLQLGKAYRYRQGLRPESRELLSQLKHAVDPGGIMNPGVLGFGGP